MPPTKATRSSITIVFSWWQCVNPVRPSTALLMRVCRTRLSRDAAHVASRGTEGRHGRPLPEQDPDVDRLGELGEEIADDHGLLFARELQLGREEPAGQVDV